MFASLDKRPIRIGTTLLPLVAFAVYLSTASFPNRASAQVVPPGGGGCVPGKCEACPLRSEEQACNQEGTGYGACSPTGCN